MIGDLGGDRGGKADWQYNLADAGDMQKAVAGEAEIGEVYSCELDVTDAQSCKDAVAATIKQFGGLDVLVNNAGVVGSGPIETFNEEDWDKIFAVNAKGIFLISKAALAVL